jgi:penicillin-binding protein 1C
MRVFISAVVIALFSFPAYALPGFDDIKASYKRSDALLLDRHGVVIHELRIDAKDRRLEWAGIRKSRRLS